MQNDIRVMQVLRVPPLGKLVVEVNLQRYEKADEIPDPNIQRLVLTAIGELVSFAGGYEKLVAAGAAPPLAGGSGPDAGAGTPAAARRAREKEQTDFLASLEAERDRLRTSSTPRQPSVLGRLGTSPLPPVAASDAGEVNIVDQIDAILQRFVSSDPSLADRSIHLEQNPSGGLLIEVDGVRYQRPAEIKEPRIQIYIKRALKEWGN